MVYNCVGWLQMSCIVKTIVNWFLHSQVVTMLESSMDRGTVQGFIKNQTWLSDNTSTFCFLPCWGQVASLFSLCFKTVLQGTPLYVTGGKILKGDTSQEPKGCLQRLISQNDPSLLFLGCWTQWLATSPSKTCFKGAHKFRKWVLKLKKDFENLGLNPSPAICNCVTLGKLLNLSKPQFLHI